MRQERRGQSQSPRGAVAVLLPGAVCAGRSFPNAPASAAPAARRSRSRSRGTEKPISSARLEADANGDEAEQLNRIDRAAVRSSRAFCDHVRIVWLTPSMDSLFAGPAAGRAGSSTVSSGDRPESRRARRAIRAGLARAQPALEEQAQRRLARRDRARGGRARRRGRRGAARMRAPARGADCRRSQNHQLSLGEAGA